MLVLKSVLFVLSADRPIATGSGTPADESDDSTRQKRSSEMRWNRLPITGSFIASESRRPLPRAPPTTASSTIDDQTAITPSTNSQ